MCCQTSETFERTTVQTAAVEVRHVQDILHHLTEAVAHVKHRCNQVEGALIGDLVQADAIPALAAVTLDASLFAHSTHDAVHCTEGCAGSSGGNTCEASERICVQH